mmetsp:Transcript_62680/g.151184  ORF Transcript_62680/g.151184 Transcript_62680/m.151184 type:complete len:218 (+) Transcript_62680:152-805(+)
MVSTEVRWLTTSAPPPCWLNSPTSFSTTSAELTEKMSTTWSPPAMPALARTGDTCDATAPWRCKSSAIWRRYWWILRYSSGGHGSSMYSWGAEAPLARSSKSIAARATASTFGATSSCSAAAAAANCSVYGVASFSTRLFGNLVGGDLPCFASYSATREASRWSRGSQLSLAAAQPAHRTRYWSLPFCIRLSRISSTAHVSVVALWPSVELQFASAS